MLNISMHYLGEMAIFC